MKLPAALLLGAATLVLSTTNSFAFCGVLQKSATANSVQAATNKANFAASKSARQLKRQYGKKLVLSPRETACVGGSVSIDANGNQVTGKPSCTVTLPFCVNP